MDDFKQKVIGGFAWEASARLFVQIASWLSTLLVARILVQEDYGIVGISGIFTGLCLKIAGMGLSNALVNKKDLRESDLSNIFWISNISSLAIYVVLYFSAPYIATIYGLPNLQAIIQVAGLMVIFSSLGMVPHAVLMKQLRFRESALISMVSNFIVIFFTLILVYSGWNYWSLIISTVIGEAFSAIAFFFVVKYIPTKPAQLKTVLPLFSYGTKLLMASLTAFASGQLAVVIASSFLGVASVGSYQMAYMLAGLPMAKIGELFHKIGFPAFSKIQDDLERTKSVFLRMHSILFMITAPMFAGIGLTADLLIPVVLGDKWLSIVDPIRILCVLNIFMMSAQLIPRVLEGIGNSTAGLIYQGILLATGSVSMLVGVQWGLNWMLIGWSVTFPLGYIYLLRVLSKTLDIPYYEFFSSIKVTIICTTIMCVGMLALDLIVSSHYGDQADISTFGLTSILALKIFTGASLFCTSYFLLDKNHLRELVGLLKNDG